MQFDCKLVGEDAEELRKQMCLVFGFPIKYEDASQEDVATFINNQVADLVLQALFQTQKQRAAIMSDQQMKASIEALRKSQPKIALKTVSANIKAAEEKPV